MKILWLSWKDKTNPVAGGAEVVKAELCDRLVADGHEVTQIVGGYPGAAREEMIDGVRVIRVGGFYTVYFLAPFYYFKHLRNWADVIIEEINTAPFGSPYLYPKKRGTKTFLFFHQLAREIWFYERIPFPFTYLFYYIIEPVLLWMLSFCKVITVSESTKQDLVRFGFRPERIEVISEGLQDTLQVEDLSKIHKYEQPTMLSVGSWRPMKLTFDVIKAYEVARQSIPELRLVIAGDTTGEYAEQCLAYIEQSKDKDDIEVLGRVSQEKKFELMQKSHIFAYPSIREGWGLLVTEANSQGTPAVVYDVSGLRDSVRHNQTGVIVSKNTPEEMGKEVANLYIEQERYDRLRLNAWEWSHEITFERSYADFLKAIKH